MIRVETCELCKGKRIVERFEQRINGEWCPMPESAYGDMPSWAISELQTTCIQRAPQSFRWADCACPRCDGRGEYVVEYFTARIF